MQHVHHLPVLLQAAALMLGALTHPALPMMRLHPVLASQQLCLEEAQAASWWHINCEVTNTPSARASLIWKAWPPHDPCGL